MATTGDSRIHAYDTGGERIEVIYDGLAKKEAPLLRVDNITASRSGELFVCEDIATEEIDIGVITRSRKVSKFLSVTGPKHVGSELTGVAFDPSGSRLYFSSQRAEDNRGAVYEVSGPASAALLPGLVLERDREPHAVGRHRAVLDHHVLAQNLGDAQVAHGLAGGLHRTAAAASQDSLLEPITSVTR